MSPLCFCGHPKTEHTRWVKGLPCANATCGCMDFSERRSARPIKGNAEAPKRPFSGNDCNEALFGGQPDSALMFLRRAGVPTFIDPEKTPVVSSAPELMDEIMLRSRLPRVERCERATCTNRKAYAGARYCGALCSALSEAKR